MHTLDAAVRKTVGSTGESVHFIHMPVKERADKCASGDRLDACARTSTGKTQLAREFGERAMKAIGGTKNVWLHVDIPEGDHQVQRRRVWTSVGTRGRVGEEREGRRSRSFIMY